MNDFIKSIAVVAIISFCLSACGGESSGESTVSIPKVEGGQGGMPSDCVDVADGNFLTDCATNVAKYMENGYSVE